MYYELKFSYTVDNAYTPDGELVYISNEDTFECINDFVKWLNKRLKNFELNDVDWDDENLYIRFFSDTKLDDVNVSTVIFGKANGDYLATTTKEVEYGEAHDYSYYEEPYYDTSEVDIDMHISAAEITLAEDCDVVEALDEMRPFKSRAEKRRAAYKDDAGNVQKGVEMFNAAMGEDLEEDYWTNRPVRYKVYYTIHDNQVLEGGSNDLKEAEQFAKACIDRISSNPWEDKHDKIDAIDSVMVYDHLQEEDVTSSDIEKYSDIVVRNLLAK